jgi:hypothetical protein
MLVHDDMALASLLRSNEDGRGAAVRARDPPGPGLARSPLGALQQIVEVVAGLAQASPRIGHLPRQALQQGAPFLPVLQELPAEAGGYFLAEASAAELAELRQSGYSLLLAVEGEVMR